uniref:GCS light chain n=1 Tax=Phallusia mammillata TaxID=59560 RepID=A0A6F9DE53_9ASCI|nr:glutamate--cysteine ligase regulatory subunit-like [Phallusia mammillata]
MSMEGDRAEVARVMTSHASVVQIHTGNIINWNLLKKHKFHQNMTSTDELMDSLHSAVQSWIGSISLDPMNIPEPQSVLKVSNHEMKAPIDPDQRESLKLSVKLFVYDWRPELIRQAVDRVIHCLDVQKLDSLMVSFPITPPSTLDAQNLNLNAPVVDMEKVKPVWKELESTVDSGHVSNIGVCDFDRMSLDQLYQWARIKPSINQINLTNCCAVPNDLIQFSREQSIQLLTHNDLPEILSARSFQGFMTEAIDDVDSVSWNPAFIARYSVLVRNRGIVHSKGYLLAAERRQDTGDQTENYRFF